MALRVQKALDTIRGHKIFKNIDNAAPLGINKSKGRNSGFKEI